MFKTSKHMRRTCAVIILFCKDPRVRHIIIIIICQNNKKFWYGNVTYYVIILAKFNIRNRILKQTTTTDVVINPILTEVCSCHETPRQYSIAFYK